MANQIYNWEKKVHFNDAPSKRDILDREQTEQKTKKIGGYGDNIIQFSNPPNQRTTFGNNGQYPLQKTLHRSKSPTIEIKITSTFDNNLNQPLQPDDFTKKNENNLSTRARVGERK